MLHSFALRVRLCLSVCRIVFFPFTNSLRLFLRKLVLRPSASRSYCTTDTLSCTHRHSDKLRKFEIRADNAPNAAAWTPMAEMSKVYARPRNRFDHLGHYMTCAYDYLLNYIDLIALHQGRILRPTISYLNSTQGRLSMLHASSIKVKVPKSVKSAL
jgi:hypothetical protein